MKITIDLSRRKSLILLISALIIAGLSQVIAQSPPMGHPISQLLCGLTASCDSDPKNDIIDRADLATDANFAYKAGELTCTNCVKGSHVDESDLDCDLIPGLGASMCDGTDNVGITDCSACNGNFLGSCAASDSTFVNEGQSNSITSGMITDGAVTSADILEGTVGSADINSNEVQRRVSPSGCPAGQSIRQVNADGTVACEADDAGITAETDPTVPGAVYGAVKGAHYGWCAGVGQLCYNGGYYFDPPIYPANCDSCSPGYGCYCGCASGYSLKKIGEFGSYTYYHWIENPATIWTCIKN